MYILATRTIQGYEGTSRLGQIRQIWNFEYHSAMMNNDKSKLGYLSRCYKHVQNIPLVVYAVTSRLK